MHKVRGFKLTLRPAEIKRRAKKAGLDLLALGLDDIEIQRLAADAAKNMAPAVLFDTFKHPDSDAAALSPIPGLAYSVILATLGPGFAPALERAQGISSEMYAVWGLLQEIALDEAVRFASTILEDEAGRESCVLSPWNALQDPAAIQTALFKLDAAKIEVRLQDGRLDPAASAVVSLSWLAQVKTRSKKKE